MYTDMYSKSVQQECAVYMYSVYNSIHIFDLEDVLLEFLNSHYNYRSDNNIFLILYKLTIKPDMSEDSLHYSIIESFQCLWYIESQIYT